MSSTASSDRSLDQLAPQTGATVHLAPHVPKVTRVVVHENGKDVLKKVSVKDRLVVATECPVGMKAIPDTKIRNQSVCMYYSDAPEF